MTCEDRWSTWCFGTWHVFSTFEPRFYFLHDMADMAYLGLPGLEASLLATATRKTSHWYWYSHCSLDSCSPGSFSWHTTMLFATVQLYTIFQGLYWPDQWWLRFCSDHAAISGCLRQKRAGQAVASDQEICRAVSTSDLKQLGLKTHETVTPNQVFYMLSSKI